MRTEAEKIILQRIRDSRTRPLEKIAMIKDEFKDKFKEVLHPTEEGFSTTHQVTTYPAVAACNLDSRPRRCCSSVIGALSHSYLHRQMVVEKRKRRGQMTDLDIPAFLRIPATGRKAATPCKNESKSWALPAAGKTENITSPPRVFSSYRFFARG